MSSTPILNPHARETGSLLRETGTTGNTGLSSGEAAARLVTDGRNELAAAKPVSPLKILLRNINNIIVYLLAAAGAAAFIMGDAVEGFAVIAAILVSIVSGFITEFNAQRSVESLQKMITTTAKVRRDGSVMEVDSTELVVGDILFLEEGDSVSADARLLSTVRFAVMESALTGESEAVDKDCESVCEADAPLGDRINMVYAGTAVTRGNAFAVVTATAMWTEMGKISSLLEEQGKVRSKEKTPLEKQLDRMGRSLMLFAGVVAVAVTLFGIAAGEDLYEMISIGIILAIAAIPEALPAVSTITLAIGMRTMARKEALVKSLPAVETLGSTTVICTDKTGTLTENQMTVTRIVLPDGRELAVTGSGYNPEGEFLENGIPIYPQDDTALSAMLLGGVLSGNASIVYQDGLWQVVGDPTEGGIAVAGMKAGLVRNDLEDSGYRRIGEIPFDSSYKYMATACLRPEKGSLEKHEGINPVVFIKGAPDVIFEMAGLNGDDEAAAFWRTRNGDMAGEGMRVIAVGMAAGFSGSGDEQEIHEALQSGITLLGLFGIIDPPREDVKHAVAVAREAGIRVIMITGDHPRTAMAIAGQIGIPGASKAITGREMDQLEDWELAERIRTVPVFARVSPANKLQIVKALNIDEEVTAMTGDGVNDAPALKGADIGVAMGIRGTEVAKEASDMILTHDRFSTIVDAVKEGRAIFDNIEKFIFYLFSCNVVEIVLIFLAIAMDLPMPVLALQILWLNLVVDVLPAMSLAWEPGEKGLMQRPPRDPKKGIVNRRFMVDMLLSGTFIGLGALAVFLFSLKTGYSEELARTISFSTLAVGQLFHMFNVRKKHAFGLDRSLLKNPVLLAALGSSLVLQAVVVYLPGLQRVMGTVSLAPFHIWVIFIGSAAPVLMIQILRLVRKYAASGKVISR